MKTTISKQKILQDRGAMLAAVRRFFAEREVLEVDTNILSTTAPIDAHIDVMFVNTGKGKLGYLHTSPEYALKKLLASGSGDIYQLSHVFRANEEGPWHHPEFSMLEWYRLELSYEEFIEETLDLIRLFLGNLPKETLAYRDLLKKYGGIDCLTASQAELYQCVCQRKIDVHQAATWDSDTLLNLLFTHLVEPELGQGKLSVVMEYPASQAALSKTHKTPDNYLVSDRFEIYHKGIELANGYDELTDPIEQRNRLEKENAQRLVLGKTSLPIDESFIHALEIGLPDCCGVAVGFDRLMQLRHNAKVISDVIF